MCGELRKRVWYGGGYSMGRDAEDTTVIVPAIAADSHPPRGVRLRLQFDNREWLVDDRHASLTIGRADDNDIVVKDHLISRVHARIEVSHNRFIVLLDQSTNGTFVQTADGDELFVRRDSLQIKGRGMLGLGRVPERGSPHTLSFICEQISGSG
jgi:adenylate cyclase